MMKIIMRLGLVARLRGQALVGALLMAATAGCGSAAPVSTDEFGSAGAPTEELGSASLALPASLSARPGTLCQVEGEHAFHRQLGFAEPGADGFVDSTSPQGAMVLGGTGTSLGYRLAQTEVEFEVTDLRETWNQEKFGPRQQVCAEVSVRNPCNLERACWHADGGWTLEKKSNPGKTTLAECGADGVTIVAEDDGSTNLASQLVSGGKYVLHVAVAQRETDPQPKMTVSFFKKWQYLHIVTANWTEPLDGYSGVRHDRMGIRSKVFGQKPIQYSAPVSASCLDCESTIAVNAQGESQGVTGPLSCLHTGLFQPPERLRLSAQLCRPSIINTLSWDRPAGVATQAISSYAVFRDGILMNGNTVDPRPSYDDAYLLMPNQTYTYQVGWRDTAGKLHELATVGVTTPPACSRQEFDDGVHKVGTVLFRFLDAPPGLPFTLDSAHEALSTHPNSATAYIADVSRGAVHLQAETFGWYDLPYNVQNLCRRHVAQPSGGFIGFDCNLSGTTFANLARQQGVPVDSYESMIYAVHGLGIAGQSSGPVNFIGATAGNIDTSAVIHESLGHGYGFNHSGNWYCLGQSPIAPGPDLFDPSLGGCQVGRYGDPHDPMGVSSRRFHTINLLRLGWLAPAETEIAKPGMTYWLGKHGSTVHPVRMLKVPLDYPFFYYVEYRSGEGFDGLLPCNTCNPRITGTNVAGQGVTVRHLRGSRLYSAGVSPDTDTLLLNAVPLRAGQSLYDKYRKLNIRVLEDDSEGARVDVVWD